MAPCKNKLEMVQDFIVWQEETAKFSHWMKCSVFSFLCALSHRILCLLIFGSTIKQYKVCDKWGPKKLFWANFHDSAIYSCSVKIMANLEWNSRNRFRIWNFLVRVGLAPPGGIYVSPETVESASQFPRNCWRGFARLSETHQMPRRYVWTIEKRRGANSQSCCIWMCFMGALFINVGFFVHQSIRLFGAHC